MFRGWLKLLGNRWRRSEELLEEARQNGSRLNHLSWQVDQLTRENRLLLGYLSLPPKAHWQGKPPWIDGGPAALAFPNSTLCRQESFEQPYFSYWARRLAIGLSYHRKAWEHVFICQALWERGAILPGARGLGFGVGLEPLPTFLASEACDVVASDVASEAATELGWSNTAQHAASLENLWRPGACSRAQFERHVGFRVCDMNDVPDDLTDFDFCWSACALEHLGSIERGLDFIERSVGCLKPGGWAVHTTEFNISSNAATIAEGGTVLFRQRDLEALADRLTAKGHRVAPFDFNPGLEPLDRYIDVAPYRAEPHLKLALEGYAVTSIGMIVQRGPD
jgi:2-polyprenyl-3-methyl-5-hydroxy-6-metoxy-1,4-benzoquinol methylase